MCVFTHAYCTGHFQQKSVRTLQGRHRQILQYYSRLPHIHRRRDGDDDGDAWIV